MEIIYHGKLWVLSDFTDAKLTFTRAPMGGTVNGEGKNNVMGNYLKQWRKRKSWNQEKAGEELGLSQSMIAKIEKGQRKIPIDRFKQIRAENLANYGK